MLRLFSFAFSVLKISWKANGFYSIISIVSKVYESTIYPFLQIYLLAKLIDFLTAHPDPTLDQLASLILVYIILAGAKVLITSYLDGKEILISTKFQQYIELTIDTKLTKLDPATFEDPAFQNILTQLNGISETLSVFLSRIIGMLDSFIKLITAGLIILTFFPLHILIIIAATIPSFIAFNKYRDLLWPFFTTKRSTVSRITSYIKDLLSTNESSKENAILKTAGVLLSKVRTSHNEYTAEFTHKVNKGLLWIVLTRLIQLEAIIYAQAVNLLALIEKNINLGQFTLAFQQTFNLAIGIDGILDHYSSINTRIRYIEVFFDFLKIEPRIKNPATPTPFLSKKTPPIIEFRNVSFKYPKTKRRILHNLDLTIGSGEKVALVGENGTGKSTIIKLLLRFYDVTDGGIFINGINIKNIDINEWHNQIGTQFQSFIRYQFTFKENVIWGGREKKYDKEKFEDALRQSGSDDVLKDLPNKEEQVVGKMFEGGIDLSGGQWQKLALARAFYREAPILILDEPTSAIDARTEAEIFDNVTKLQDNKSVLVISHKFSTVRNADKILVLENGNIIESGNHDGLMKEKGMYAELFALQAKGFK